MAASGSGSAGGRKRPGAPLDEPGAKRAAGGGSSKTSIVVDDRRVRCVNDVVLHGPASGPVVYWMSRDQRVQDNWALLYAQQRALEAGVPLVVVFNLVGEFLQATIRQFGWMLKGLEGVSADCEALGIPFIITRGAAEANIPALATSLSAGLVVSDFSAVRIGAVWRKAVGGALAAGGTPLHEVDAHNIVPVWEASPKIEYAARTLRRKLHAQLPVYLTDLPRVASQAAPAPKGAGSRYQPMGMEGESTSATIPWKHISDTLQVDRSVPEVAWAVPGEAAALAALTAFTGDMQGYATTRNDPVAGKLSNLSPYFHFGQLSAQRAALAARAARTTATAADVDSFIEEAVVRRELADNYCFYNPDGYDKLEGLYPQYGNESWAQVSLAAHAQDTREHVYTTQQLEEGGSHDDLWNAAQAELVHVGKMHGFMRMYWAKKILEWTPSPEEALRVAIYLNDRYSLDGRDPNGYVGCAWSIGGVHDQGWKERPVFGKIRFMNYAGCKRKFSVPAYIAKVAKAVAAVAKHR